MPQAESSLQVDDYCTPPAAKRQKVEQKASKTSTASQRALTLTDMPLEVLVLIISYLSFRDMLNLERVSRWMKTVTRTAWKNVKGISTRTEFENCEFVSKYHCADVIDDNLAMNVMKRGNIRYLAVGAPIGETNITFKILKFGMLMPNLETLYFHRIFFQDSDLSALAKCHNLKNVTFIACAIPEPSLAKFFNKSKNLTHVNMPLNISALNGYSFLELPSTLRHLNIEYNLTISVRTTLLIARKFPNLQSFYFDVNDSYPFALHINEILYCLTKVKSLKICSGVRFEPTCPASLDFSRNTDLEVLHLSENGYIKEQSFKSLENCKKFRSLYFNLWTHRSCSKLRFLTGFKSLKVLYLTGMVNLDDVSHVVRSCGIRYVRLCSDNNMSPESVSAFVDATPSLIGSHCWIEKPAGFPSHYSLVRDYFADELEAMWKSDGIIDPNRPIFSHTSFICQSELKKMPLDSPEYYEKNYILEFGKRA